jgi:hypothetical protein
VANVESFLLCLSCAFRVSPRLCFGPIAIEAQHCVLWVHVRRTLGAEEPLLITIRESSVLQPVWGRSKTDLAIVGAGRASNGGFVPLFRGWFVGAGEMFCRLFRWWRAKAGKKTNRLGFALLTCFSSW